MARVFLGLGANLGARRANLRAAVGRLQGPQLCLSRTSSLYQSRPLGPVSAQPLFINAVAELETELPPRQLLRCIQSVEAELGRRAGLPQGPRLIDLDLLLYDERIQVWPELVLPHPELANRAFVLNPLLELEPDLRDPRSGRPLAEALARLTAQGVQRLGERL